MLALRQLVLAQQAQLEISQNPGGADCLNLNNVDAAVAGAADKGMRILHETQCEDVSVRRVLVNLPRAVGNVLLQPCRIPDPNGAIVSAAVR
ncbi:hypothetical protein HYQ44_012885 [Verticillium longisporum]|nr:hypothetical protein HYQ44_012885 [Verticillium longisporum]